jgi:hypothetical protein
MYGMLLAPKALGAAAVGGIERMSELGSPVRFAVSFVTELILCVFLMVQQKPDYQTISGITLIGKPQSRAGGRHSVFAFVNPTRWKPWRSTALLSGMVSGHRFPFGSCPHRHVSLALPCPLGVIGPAPDPLPPPRALGTPGVYAAPASSDRSA